MWHGSVSAWQRRMQHGVISNGVINVANENNREEINGVSGWRKAINMSIWRGIIFYWQ
jgi:hypothetical protein